MLLLVDLGQEGPYIADVGFGGQSLTGPLKFVMEEEQQTPHEPFRIISSGNEYILQCKIQEQWKSLYLFSLLEHLPQDYEALNWYTSTHPRSIFISNLIAARTVPGKRYELRNNEFTVHHLNGPSQKNTIITAAELNKILVEVFNIKVEGLQGLEEKLKEVVRG
jgi:N-hydroxyarylamine O-acetyltransferase